MFHSKLTACLLVGLFATAAVAAPLAATTATGFAEGPRLAQSPVGRLILGNLGRLMVLRSELDVTDQQRDEIRQALSAHKSEIVAEAKSVWQKRTALRAAVTAEKPDEKAIRQAADELGAAIGDAAVLAARIRGEVAPVFTDAQKAKIRTCRQECNDAVDQLFTQLTEVE